MALAILTDDDNGTLVKIMSSVLIVAFAAVYLDGFRRQHRREEQALADPERGGWHWAGDQSGGQAGGRTAGSYHFITLVTLALALLLVAGVGPVGIIAFVVVFAVFHFRWLLVSIVFVVGLGVAVIAPVLAGRFADLWFLSLIVAAMGGAAVVIRLAEGYQFDQAHLRTGRAIGDERTRVARDVHDVLGHSVTAAILKVELCQRLLDGLDAGSDTGQAQIEQCRHHLAELESISRGALAEIRSTVGGLRATDLANEVTAARTVLADAGVELLVTGDMAEIPDRHRSMLAWVVREAVTNIIRHARAERCLIELAPGRDGVLLRISDDGVGLGTAGEGNGLRGLRERVAASGARLYLESDIESEAGSSGTGSSGTSIEVTL
ncbi:MAG: histidine kinase [Acidimicrobiia bacterium]|nr:histidine kinase [Acidimicrobiia bacterium]